MTASTSSAFLLPGQPLPSAPSNAPLQPSTGVYTRSNHTLSSLTGRVSYSTPPKSKSTKTSTTTASISTPLSPLLRLPEPDSIVLARITRITSRQALCSILLVGGTEDAGLSLSQALSSGVANHAAGEDPSGLDFSGVIRQQDVRLTDIDKVKMVECFRVGDLVRARVVSLGDSRSYYLTTASNELGVIFATAVQSSDTVPSSLASDPFLPSALRQNTRPTTTTATTIPGALKPLNWQEMVDPLTGKRERRKVAKPEGL